jgi:FtsZ-binding cell division protein ZapB
VSDDRSPIGIVNKEAADRRRQRRKGHIQIIEEDRKRLREENECLIAELAEARDLARRAAQMLIEEIGAPGPENVDETATRAVATITRLTAELAEMKERADGELPSYTEQRCAVENAKLEDQLAEALRDWQWMLDALMSGRLWFDRRWHQWRVDGYSYDVDRFDLVRAAIDAGKGE